MHPITVKDTLPAPESVRGDATASLIEEGGPASLAGIVLTPGSVELVGVIVQVVSLFVDLALMAGLTIAMQSALGPAGPWVSGVVWFLPPIFWRIYGRSPGMALFGLYLVRLKRDDAVRPSVLLGFVRLWLQLLTLVLLPFAFTGGGMALLASRWPILPVDRLLGVRVFRYRLLAPPGRTRVERGLDAIGIFSGVRLTSTGEREPRDSFGRAD
jgi:hypothetical protein